MSRKTTRESLNKFYTGVNKAFDITIRDLLFKIAEGEILMEKQDVYNDDEFINTEYYGSYKNIGITSRSQKRINGINPLKYLIIEIDEEENEIVLQGTIAAKAWGLSILQNKTPRNVKRIPNSTINSLLKSFNEKDNNEE
jgi:hypothetical protein